MTIIHVGRHKFGSSSAFCQDKLCDAEGIKQEMEKMRESSERVQALAEYVLNTRNLEHNSELVASDVDVNDLNSDIT